MGTICKSLYFLNFFYMILEKSNVLAAFLYKTFDKLIFTQVSFTNYSKIQYFADFIPKCSTTKVFAGLLYFRTATFPRTRWALSDWNLGRRVLV